jgi:tRNA-specific adenosine deaminase 3
MADNLPEEHDDGWGGLSGVGQDQEDSYTDAGPLGHPADEIVPEEQFPFVRLRLTPDEEIEEEERAIRTGMKLYQYLIALLKLYYSVQAWVVDLPDPKNITKILK